MDFKKLEYELYDIANASVGDVGPDWDGAFMDSRYHALAFFCIQRKYPKRSEIIDVWTKWIRAYCDFKKLHTPEAGLLMDNPDLTIRWLQKPVVEFGFEFSMNPDSGYRSRRACPEDFSFVHVKAYLVIHRTDCEPQEVKCQRCKEMDKALAGPGLGLPLDE